MRANRLGLRILGVSYTAVIDPALGFMELDQWRRQIAEANDPVTGLRETHVGAVDGGIAAWLRGPQEMLRDEAHMLKKFLGRRTIANIAFAVCICEERDKWGGVDGEVHAVLRELIHRLDTIPLE